jgi:ATP-binding cassette subfamily B protein
VELDDVAFTFDRATVLDGVSLRIAAGERVAIIGESGVGKSTIADLLVRHTDPQRGVIRLDGHDVRTLTLETFVDTCSRWRRTRSCFTRRWLPTCDSRRLKPTKRRCATRTVVGGTWRLARHLSRRHGTVLGERGRRCRLVNVSASRWRVRCSPIRAC